MVFSSKFLSAGVPPDNATFGTQCEPKPYGAGVLFFLPRQPFFVLRCKYYYLFISISLKKNMRTEGSNYQRILFDCSPEKSTNSIYSDKIGKLLWGEDQYEALGKPST